MTRDLGQIKALLFRRYTMMKRMPQILVRILVPTVIYAAVAVLFEFLMSPTQDYNPDFPKFGIQRGITPEFAVIRPSSLAYSALVNEVSQLLKQKIEFDTSAEPLMRIYEDVKSFEDDFFEIQVNNSGYQNNLLYAVEIAKDGSTGTVEATIFYNKSAEGNVLTSSNAVDVFDHLLWKQATGGNLELKPVLLTARFLKNLGSSLSPLYLVIGLITLVGIFAEILIDDVKKGKRNFLLTRQLRIRNYWISSFIIDFILWTIFVLIYFIVLVSAKSTLFTNNFATTLYIFEVYGISIILSSYVFSFIFEEPESGSGYIVLIMMIPVFISTIVSMVIPMKSASAWVFSMFPISGIYQLLTNLATVNPGFLNAWSHESTFPLMLMSIVHVPLWSLILYFVEHLRLVTDAVKSKKRYSEYVGLFKKNQEPTLLEEQFSSSAVSIEHVSHLFFDTNGEPIPAVKNVSLAVGRGSVFGFLGANGAGKTTLLKLITSELPLCSGKITVEGVDVSNTNRAGTLSICPQFNDHLALRLTVLEHIKFFGMFNGLDTTQAVEEFIPLLELTEEKDKTMEELSGGNARKTCVLISFLSNASVILLDEPTSSLDPVARKRVHEMINMRRGKTTFMLCTHLLDEAESLCDEISIMLKGSIKAIGTPQYLSNKFGTEYKIDMLLTDSSEEISRSVSNFMSSEFPNSTLTIKRLCNRVYSVPIDSLTMAELFRKMKKSLSEIVGVKFFTCSSSSLEKVFLEMVARSEIEEDDETLLEMEPEAL